MLSYLTAGDSHGPMIMGILEGFPAQVPLREQEVNRMLQRRQGGYGRSKRQQIEQDRAEIVSGVWKGYSTGGPIGVLVRNRAAKAQETVRPRAIPRPGHADLAGAWKYGWEHDFNPIIERSSARETAMRVAIGAICKSLLEQLGIWLLGYVRQIGNIASVPQITDLDEFQARVLASAFYGGDPEVEEQWRRLTDHAREQGDSLGGVVEVIVEGLPPGIGGLQHPDRRLDARLAQAMMSIPSVKAVEIGDGVANAGKTGSEVHDEIQRQGEKIVRPTNRCGGIEGGISNGDRLVIRNYHKPIPTMVKGAASIHLESGEPTRAPYIRSDVVVVPAASVVAEAVAAFVLAQAVLEKFGSDHLGDIQASMQAYRNRLKWF